MKLKFVDKEKTEDVYCRIGSSGKLGLRKNTLIALDIKCDDRYNIAIDEEDADNKFIYFIKSDNNKGLFIRKYGKEISGAYLNIGVDFF